MHNELLWLARAHMPWSCHPAVLGQKCMFKTALVPWFLYVVTHVQASVVNISGNIMFPYNSSTSHSHFLTFYSYF